MKNEVNVQGQWMHCYPFLMILSAVMHERRCKFLCNNLIWIRKWMMFFLHIKFWNDIWNELWSCHHMGCKHFILPQYVVFVLFCFFLKGSIPGAECPLLDWLQTLIFYYTTLLKLHTGRVQRRIFLNIDEEHLKIHRNCLLIHENWGSSFLGTFPPWCKIFFSKVCHKTLFWQNVYIYI